MKRTMAMLLTMLMLCTGTALAAQWREGTGPSKPYLIVPEVNLEKAIGYMMFFPSAHMRIEHACRQLILYLPREDVKVGDGTFYLRDEKGNAVWQTPMDDAQTVRQREITEDELDGLLWGGGTCFEFMLPKSLELGKPYHVTMTQGCIVSTDGKVASPEIGGADAWSFEVEGEYGVSEMEYRRPKENGRYEDGILNAQAGDEIRFTLQLGGDAVQATIYSHENTVSFLNAVHEESGEITGEVTADAPRWGVAFMDEMGNVLSQVDFW